MCFILTRITLGSCVRRLCAAGRFDPERIGDHLQTPRGQAGTRQQRNVALDGFWYVICCIIILLDYIVRVVMRLCVRACLFACAISNSVQYTAFWGIVYKLT